MMYADVILPLSLANTFTYRIPSDLEQGVQVGCRVIVQFATKRYYTAIVLAISDKEPTTSFEIKDIYALLDGAPILRRPQLRFWQWIASYYMCKLGEVYKAALPSGLKLESETVVSLQTDFEAIAPLRRNEQAILDAFEGLPVQLSVTDLEKRTSLRNVLPILTALIDKGAIEVCESLKKGFTPRLETYIRLAESLLDEDKLKQTFEDIKRAKKQELLLVSFLDLSQVLNPSRLMEVSKKELLAFSGETAATLTALIKRGVLETYTKEIGRLHARVCRTQPIKPLTEPQTKAYQEILAGFKAKDVALLFGVTSSGKTEVYIHLIEDMLQLNRQVLYLLPEIAITTQITERLAVVFGDRLLVYHSRFSDNERVEVWNKLLNADQPMVVLGVRSALFLPYKDLGLIIVDEEHEPSYKQQDPAPRYHARSAAIVLAGMHGAKTLLGSATPSVDTYFNAVTDKYALIELTTRYKDIAMPEIVTVDLKELRRRKLMSRDALFSPLLIEKMQEAIARKEQVILFQNRRGFAPMIECRECAWTPQCVNCDVSLTFHKGRNQLICHYCGYTYQLPKSCPTCKGTDLRTMGFGTERVEEELSLLMPDVKTDRLDFDTARTRSAFERIISDFEKGKTQVLIGTQMLSKGLDFDNVTVVGILSADNLMNFPDFRSHERAFQLMVQVSGRAGRKHKRGLVLLQTTQPTHPLIELVKQFDYKAMAMLQLSERNLFRYPPFYRLITLVLRSRNEITLNELSVTYARKLHAQLGDRVLGPVTPSVTRVQTFHVRKLVLKIEISAQVAAVRQILESVYQEMAQIKAFNQLVVHYDVDPI